MLTGNLFATRHAPPRANTSTLKSGGGGALGQHITRRSSRLVLTNWQLLRRPQYCERKGSKVHNDNGKQNGDDEKEERSMTATALSAITLLKHDIASQSVLHACRSLGSCCITGTTNNEHRFRRRPRRPSACDIRSSRIPAPKPARRQRCRHRHTLHAEQTD